SADLLRFQPARIGTHWPRLDPGLARGAFCVFHFTPGSFPIGSPRVKILFIGDIVGEPGRKAVTQLVPVLRMRHNLAAVVVNGENSAGGSGITPKTAEEIFAAGVDAITSGDHLWDQKEVVVLLNSEPRFLRPLNYPPGTAGH